MSFPAKGIVSVGQGVNRIELSPEILNYTIQEPNVGYYLEGYDTQWTILPQNNLNNIIYVNLPAGKYTFHLAIFDSAGERVLEERKFTLEKAGELYEQPVFILYMLTVASLILIWFTWLIVQKQLNKQEIITNVTTAGDIRTA